MKKIAIAVTYLAIINVYVAAQIKGYANPSELFVYSLCISLANGFFVYFVKEQSRKTVAQYRHDLVTGKIRKGDICEVCKCGHLEQTARNSKHFPALYRCTNCHREIRRLYVSFAARRYSLPLIGLFFK